jgi:1-deoxy-D-xylulose-5-phosphate synthase
MSAIPLGKAKLRREGSDIAILSFGTLLDAALEAGDRLGATVIDMRFVKPIDEKTIEDLSATHKLFVTIEENAVMGGAGAAVNEFLVAAELKTPVINLGLPDRHIPQGIQSQMRADCGLDAEGIIRAVRNSSHATPATSYGEQVQGTGNV